MGRMEPLVVSLSSLESYDIGIPDGDTCFTLRGTKDTPSSPRDIVIDVDPGPVSTNYPERTPINVYDRTTKYNDILSILVGFEGFSYSSNGVLEFASVFPQRGLEDRLKQCTIDVIGCANDAEIIKSCNELPIDQCLLCKGDECVPKMRVAANLDVYRDISPLYNELVKHMDSPCELTKDECIRLIDRKLNCGVANLRAIYAIAGIRGSTSIDETLINILDKFDLRYPIDRDLDKSVFLMRACHNIIDGYVFPNVKLVRANDSDQTSLQCWVSYAEELNRTAIIQLRRDNEGRYGGCIEHNASRHPTERT